MSVCKLVHFATMSRTQVLLQEAKMSVRFYILSLFVCLLLQISFYMSATQAPLEVMKMSVK